MRTFFTFVVFCLVAGSAAAQKEIPPIPGRPLGTLAALAEIDSVRKENAQLKAMLIGRDRELANLRYELGKQILELQADIAQLRLSSRAGEVMPTLRELFKAEPDDQFDWSRGVFVTPPEKKETSK